MYELSVAFKYLLPKRKQLSVTLIAIMSVGVISLVVWLILIFLSVTSGMEKNWLKKLTDLNAPVRITPTQAYFSSYYYNIDSICHQSNYQLKTIREKALSEFSDPYDPDFDEEIPHQFSNKDVNADLTFKDPVKITYEILSKLKNNSAIRSFQDFEMSGGLLKLQLLRSSSPCFTVKGMESINFLSQVSYISSFPSNNPYLYESLLPPSIRDIENLLYLSTKKLEGTNSDTAPKIKSTRPDEFAKKIDQVLSYAGISTLKTTTPAWRIPTSLIADSHEFRSFGYFQAGKLMQVCITQKDITGSNTSFEITEGKLKKENDLVFFETKKERHDLTSFTPIITTDDTIITTDISSCDLSLINNPSDICLPVSIKIQNQTLEGIAPWHNVKIDSCLAQNLFKAQPKKSPPWAYATTDSIGGCYVILPEYEQNDYPILLPKNFQDSGVLIGDRGFISYNSSTLSSIQEMRLSIRIAGFYDPGIMSVGNKCIIAPHEVTKAINSTNSSHFFDKIATSGLQIWLNDISNAEQVKQKIQEELAKHHIDKYWDVSSYQDYDFAKDLLQQFQSDKYLFTMIAIIIITVACCNIISLLVLLVNDKKKEIGILLSMGASSKSIAVIFSLCGVIMGTIGCVFGCIMAHMTLKNIDTIVSLLSTLQGHQAFNSNFYGAHLPDQLSQEAVFFVVLATPILALSAGLIPAIKASLLKPASILRSE